MFEFTKTITFHKNDFKTYGISLNSLMNVFEEIAILHAEKLGIGFDSLIKKNKIWVILKLKIDILLPVDCEKEYTLKTYIVDSGKFDCDRFFEIMLGDKILIKAVYNWCLIDTLSRKLASLDSIDYPVQNRKSKDMSLKLNKFDFVNLNYKSNFIVNSDCLDKNHHMNNKVYGTLIEELFNREFKQVLINFDHEAKLNDELIINYSYDEKEGKILSKINDDVCFCSVITF